MEDEKPPKKSKVMVEELFAKEVRIKTSYFENSRGSEECTVSKSSRSSLS